MAALAFSLPVLLGLTVIVLYTVLGIGPVGMENDMNVEYVEFLSYFRRTVLSRGDFFYSFHKGFGGEMTAFYAYYFASPFNLIVLLFNQRNMPYALMVLILVKIGCSGLTMNTYLNQVFYRKWYSLAFSTGYALMGYSVAYFYNYMWLDGVIMLPIVIMGLYRLVCQKRISFLYIFSLFGAIIFNYYIGWMVCIFCGIYMLYLLVTAEDTLKEKVKTFLRFCISSILAAGMSCFLLVPTLRAVAGSAKNTSGLRMDFNRNFRIVELFPRFLSGAKIDKDAGLPNILCGSLMFFLLIGFFVIRKKIKPREKIGAALVFLLLFISMWLQFLNLVWHGFNYNIGYPYRYSFVVSFFVLTLAYKSFYLIESMLSEKRRLRKILVTAFVAAQLFDITLYAYGHLNTGVVRAGDYRKEVAKNQAAVDGMKAADPSVYRMEKLYRRTLNDACQNNYYGLTHYSSSVALEPIYFLEKMGLTRNGSDYIIQYRNGVTAFADSLLGVKYILAKGDSEVNTNYRPMPGAGDIKGFRNPYALPFAAACSNDIMDVYPSNDYANGFQMQNRYADSMVEAKTEIYQEAEWEVSYENLEVEGDGPFKVTKLDAGQDGLIRYRIPITQENELYTTIFSWKKDGAQLYVNGKLQPDFLMEGFATTRLGRFAPGDTVEAELRITKEQLKLEHVYFYYENGEELSKWRGELDPYGAHITKMTNSMMKGGVRSDEAHSRLLFAVPYDRRWRLFVDGVPTGTEEAFEGLLSAPLAPGDHVFMIRYAPDGLKTGGLISGVSLMVLIALFIFDYIIQRMRKNERKNKNFG